MGMFANRSAVGAPLFGMRGRVKSPAPQGRGQGTRNTFLVFSRRAFVRGGGIVLAGGAGLQIFSPRPDALAECNSAVVERAERPYLRLRSGQAFWLAPKMGHPETESPAGNGHPGPFI